MKLLSSMEAYSAAKRQAQKERRTTCVLALVTAPDHTAVEKKEFRPKKDVLEILSSATEFYGEQTRPHESTCCSGINVFK